MSQKGTTKDELFLLKLREMALSRGSVTEEIDRYAVGQAVGLAEKAVDTIVKHLAQANFVKKGTDQAIYLTPNGLSLISILE